MCVHASWLPAGACAVCTHTVHEKPENQPPRPDTREKRRYGGTRSNNPRATTFQITKRVEPCTIEKDSRFDSPIGAAAKATITGRFGKMHVKSVDFASIARIIRGDFHKL